MSPREIGTRVGQEAAKRIDLMLYRLGVKQPEPLLRSDSVVGPVFFFGDNNLEVARTCELLEQKLPSQAKKIIEEADSICRHEFCLLGYEKLAYGVNIDWHRDAVHNTRSPLKPWFKIDFLDFREVGDHKIVWELNRHQHLVTLAKAWRLSGRGVYISELVDQWYSWKRENPYPLGINWASSLEVAFRSISWLWLQNLLTGCAELPPNFNRDLRQGVHLHGRHIERYLSTYFSPNTHLLGEAVALFFIGTMHPEVPAARRWRKNGWKIILDESSRQVRVDGIYFEQALYYHVYALDFFLHARQLAILNGRQIPQQFDCVIEKMLAALEALSFTGTIEGFGDDDGGRVFNSRRNRIEHMTDPLALGAILYNRGRHRACDLTEEALWLFRDRAIEAFEKPTMQAAAASKAFEAGGIYLINDDLPFAQQMMIDAGPQGTGHSGHGHADALSIRLLVNGHRVLIDPGTFCYISEDESRNHFRGTGAHNTLRVDGLDQAVPDGPFAWSAIPKVVAESWINGKSFDFFAGSHNGYCRLGDAVKHRRSVFHVKGGFWWVHDRAEGTGHHLLETFWHLTPEVQIEKSWNTFRLGIAADQGIESLRLALLLDENSAWNAEIVAGSVSRAYGQREPGQIIQVGVNANLPQECAILLVPVTGETHFSTFSSIDQNQAVGVSGYCYGSFPNAEWIFLRTGEYGWKCGGWASDAKLLYCKLEQGRFARVILVSGSFAEWRGKRFVSQPSKLGVLEWSDPGVEETGMDASSCRDSLMSEFEFLDSIP
jgi:hypothetical protein